MRFRKTIQTICFVLFAAFMVNAQEASEEKTEKSLLNGTVERESLSQPIFVNQPSKVLSKKSLTIQGVKVLTKFHKFDKRQYFSMVESCDIKNDELELAYNDIDFLLDGFTSYKINGKVFAYQANFWFIQVEDNYEIGAGVLPIYVDEKGNGHFKLRCDDKTDLKSLTEWIKTYKANSTYNNSMDVRRKQRPCLGVAR